MLNNTQSIPVVKQLKEKQFTLIDLSTMHSRAHVHRHDFYTLVYVEEGEGEQFIDYEQVDIVADRVYFIAPKKVHYWSAKCKGIAMMISPEFLQDSRKILDTIFLCFKNVVYIDIQEDTKSFFDNTLNLFMQSYHSQYSSTLSKSLLTSFLLLCIEIKNSTNKTKGILIPTRLLCIHKLIENNYIDETRANFYAKELQMSIQHVNRILKNSTGKTLVQHLRERKILEAKRELVFTSKTIDAISESLGFFDTSNFTKYFKKSSSVAPSKFREMFKKYH